MNLCRFSSAAAIRPPPERYQADFRRRQIYGANTTDMNNDKNDINAEIKREIAFFVMYGLISGLLKPASKAEFAEAHRVIFDRNSLELRQLGKLMSVDPERIQQKMFGILTAAGFPCDCDSGRKH